MSNNAENHLECFLEECLSVVCHSVSVILLIVVLFRTFSSLLRVIQPNIILLSVIFRFVIVPFVILLSVILQNALTLVPITNI